MIDPKIGLHEKSERLIHYLRSIVYWGIPIDKKYREEKRRWV